MIRKEITSHGKRKSYKLAVILWGIVFAFVGALLMYLFAMGGADSVGEILSKRNYWLSNGVVDGLIIIGFFFIF